MELNVGDLGQVFTKKEIVLRMLELKKNKGSVLEPSAGDGAFSSSFLGKKVTSIEFDSRFAKKHGFLNIDFFSYSIDNKFDTIIGNPPYVRYQSIHKKTKELLLRYQSEHSLFDSRTNLYLFFVHKAILHLKEYGELIFITPREFLKATSAHKLNRFIYENGSITDIVEMGDAKIWENATPNTIIWRFEKGNFARITSDGRRFVFNEGQLLFVKNRYAIKLSDVAMVKVGAASGADAVFEHEDGVNVVCSYTAKTGKYRKMLFNTRHPHLEKHKEVLLRRKIKKFNEENWYTWGRLHYQSNRPRVYVNVKTRNKKPFFLSEEKVYDGSILAIFPHKELTKKELGDFCTLLNKVDWEELGFVVDGRFVFGQKSLEMALLPGEFEKFLC